MDSCIMEAVEENPSKTPENAPNATPSFNSWNQIANEHCYPKLMAQWTSVEHSLPTYHIFQKLVESTNYRAGPDSGVESDGEEKSLMDKQEMEYEGEGEGQREEEEDAVIDVVHVTPPPSLPYNERKVASVMHECTQHMNLVRLPLENPDMIMEKVLSESSYQQQLLVKKIIEVLRGENLARLVFSGVTHQPIQRRLSCDRAARRVRKILGDVKWSPKLTHWLHRTLLRALDNDLLPIYLDILQVLKSKCPSLVEQMVHGLNPGEGSNEAVNLLLKRPWSVMVGMAQMDKHVHFDPAPLFVTIPHTSCLLGGRRWRLWQNQLSSIGKVFPVVPPDYLRFIGQEVTQREAAETLFHCTMTRLQELKEQYPSRPIVLISWSVGCRIACKIAEVEKVACLVNLGLNVKGIGYSWKISGDPFSNCTTPSIFVIGEKGLTSSWRYVEELRSRMNVQTSLVLVHAADDLLRLPFKLKQEQCITQAMLDRLIQDRIYEFLVYLLPCSFPNDMKQTRKRKLNSEEQCNSQLSSATPNSAIVLTSHSAYEETLSPMLKGLFSSGKMSVASLGRSSSTAASVKAFSNQLVSNPDIPPSKLPKIGRPPKSTRPRSKSVSVSLDQKLKGKNSVRNRSSSSDIHLNSCSPIPSPGNRNSNNSNEASPNTLLSITHFKSQIPLLLPITPPKNPYENPNQISDPKIRKQLNL